METIPQAFRANVAKFEAKTALQYKTNNIRENLTFGELLLSVERVANSLMALGIKKGDRVALLSENRPRWAMVDLGTIMAGAIAVPLHTTFSGHQLLQIIKHSEAKILIISSPELYSKVKPGFESLTTVEKIILYFEPDNGVDPRVMHWNKFVEQKIEQPFPEMDGDDVFTIIYSSGTTGDPKGVSLTHTNILTNIDGALKFFPLITEKEVFMSFLPISHSFERTAGHFLPLLRVGATIAYVDRSKSMSRNIMDVRPTILISVPRVFDLIYENIVQKVQREGGQKARIFNWALRQQKSTWNHVVADYLVFRKIRNALGGRIWGSVSGGAPLNPKIARFFEKVGIPLFEGYGLTETSPVITANSIADRTIGTVGKPIQNVHIQIAPDGEVLCKGPNVMKGYWMNPQATAEAIDKDGWFHTGDIGYIDDDKNLVISGRKKEMIVTAGGKNVWPETVEQVLNATKYINQSFVVGDNQKLLSALIIPHWELLEEWTKDKPELKELSRETLIQHPDVIKLFRGEIRIACRQVAEYERVSKFTIILNDFSWDREELTPTLKLRRKIIYDHYRKEIESMLVDTMSSGDDLI